MLGNIWFTTTPTALPDLRHFIPHTHHLSTHLKLKGVSKISRALFLTNVYPNTLPQSFWLLFISTTTKGLTTAGLKKKILVTENDHIFLSLKFLFQTLRRLCYFRGAYWPYHLNMSTHNGNERKRECRWCQRAALESYTFFTVF